MNATCVKNVLVRTGNMVEIKKRNPVLFTKDRTPI